MTNFFENIKDNLRIDSGFWREFMRLGIQHGPDAFVKHSPAFFGVAFGLALPEMRHRVQANLQHILGPRPAVREALEVAEVFANYGHCLTEAMLVGTDRGYAAKPHTLNTQYYHQCLDEGRGIIMATAHTGGWDVAGAMLRRYRNQQVFTVMARERDSRARKIQDEMRTKAGVGLIHIGDSPFDALPLLTHLKNNALIAMQIDRSPGSMRVRNVKLLGKPWGAPEGPLRLAAASGAPILPVFTRRISFMQYEACVHPPIRLSRRPSQQELDQAAQRLMDVLGEFLKTYPTQWFDFVRHEPPIKAAPP